MAQVCFIYLFCGKCHSNCIRNHINISQMTRRQAHQIINVLMQNSRSKIWDGKHSTLDEVQVYFELVHELYIRPPCVFNLFNKCRSDQCRFSHSPLETTKPTKFICARLDRIYNSRKNIYDSFDRVSVEHNVMRGKLALEIEREKIIHTISEIEHNAKRQKINQDIPDRPPPEYTPPEYTLPDIPSPTLFDARLA